MKKPILIVITTLLLMSCSINNDFKPIKIEYDEAKIIDLEDDITVDGYSELIDKFNAIGLKIIESGEQNHPVLRGHAKYMKFENDMLLQVFEYDNAKALYEGIISISDDGFSIAEIRQGKIVGGTEVEWVDQPNFYRYKNLIILYVGVDDDIIDYLSNISDEDL